jgi:pyroglutamyl-peptidase
MVLITGFGPYREDMNASGVLVRSLKEDLPTTLDHLKDLLAFEVVTCDDTSRETEHLSLENQLDELLRRHEPELCIHTGQAPPYNKIMVERIATNSFMREVIDPGRPVAYWSNLPGTEGLSVALEAHNIPAGNSFYAGQHLCNHILYSSRYFAEKNALPHKSGFIHVPVLPEQARHHRDAPTMPLDMSRKALSIIISQVVKAHRLQE